MPFDIRKLSIKIFENRTSETGIQNTVTNDLVNEFSKRGNVEVVSESISDSVMTGVVENMKINTVSRQTESVSDEMRVIVTISVEIADRNSVVFWKTDSVSDSEVYDVSTNKLTTEFNRKQAIAEISERLAQKVYEKLTEDF
ncbi:MAG: hypothetical protein K9L30_12325 [Desulfobacterales bacterium]|nr:hypothetical protein [Desulfobacterales bacterium]